MFGVPDLAEDSRARKEKSSVDPVIPCAIWFATFVTQRGKGEEERVSGTCEEMCFEERGVEMMAGQ